MQEPKYCSTTGINKETLDLLNLDFLHFLLHSVKDLYLTQRHSCWKRAKAFFSLCFFHPSLKEARCNKGSWRGEGGGDFSWVTLQEFHCYIQSKSQHSSEGLHHFGMDSAGISARSQQLGLQRVRFPAGAKSVSGSRCLNISVLFFSPISLISRERATKQLHKEPEGGKQH